MTVEMAVSKLLAEPRRPTGEIWTPELAQAKLDATLLWIKAQEDAGMDVIGDGEQSRQHFVHGFLEQVEGIDFEHKVEMGIRNDRYKAFEPFYIGWRNRRGRAGMGLPLAQEIANQHGGSIEIDPEYADGCRVRVSLTNALPRE